MKPSFVESLSESEEFVPDSRNIKCGFALLVAAYHFVIVTSSSSERADTPAWIGTLAIILLVTSSHLILIKA